MRARARGRGRAPPLAEACAHLVSNVGGELLVLGAGERIEEGKLAGAEEDLGDAELVVGLVEAERHEQYQIGRAHV